MHRRLRRHRLIGRHRALSAGDWLPPDGIARRAALVTRVADIARHRGRGGEILGARGVEVDVVERAGDVFGRDIFELGLEG